MLAQSPAAMSALAVGQAGSCTTRGHGGWSKDSLLDAMIDRLVQAGVASSQSVVVLGILGSQGVRPNAAMVPIELALRLDSV